VQEFWFEARGLVRCIPACVIQTKVGTAFLQKAFEEEEMRRCDRLSAAMKSMKCMLTASFHAIEHGNKR
jgi:hypothetical protein